MAPRRRADNGDVRGPTSALTSFLKDQGIRSRNIRNGFSRNINEAEQPVAGPSNAVDVATPSGGTLTDPSSPAPGGLYNLGETPEPSEALGTPIRGVSSSIPATPADEDDYFDFTEVTVQTSSSVQKVVATADVSYIEINEQASTSKLKTSRASKKRKVPDSETEDDLSLAKVVPKGRYADRKPGSFAMCAECNKKFTVTRYTNSHPQIPGGLLCGPCDKELGPGLFAADKKKPAQTAAPAKKKARAVKGKDPSGLRKASVLSLAKCCIEIIGKLIDDVEEFGDIGHTNRDKVCKIVCKNRDLTSENVKLFLDVENTSLSLYDSTRLEPDCLRMLANLCPNLESLQLFMCGHMDNETIEHYAQRLTKLKHIELYGAFLVKKEAWIRFFDKLASQKRALQTFKLRQSPRIDNSALQSLVSSTSASLTSLQLAEMGGLDDGSLQYLHPLKHLQHLDLSRGGLRGESYKDDGIVALLENVGHNLQSLILDENTLLTDRTLIEGIKVNCPSLIALSLHNLGEILPTGIAELFAEDWVNQKGMVRLNLQRCIQLDDQAIEAVVRHSGQTLIKLDLNSVDGITEKGLKILGSGAPNLTELDISFVREVDDFLLKHMLDNLPSIQRISIYGNNRISDSCPSKPGVLIKGHEMGVASFE